MNLQNFKVMKKLKALIIALGLVFVLAFAVSIKPSQAVMEEDVFCYGYYWMDCEHHPEGTVIRCDCEGGTYCAAKWQELCQPQPE